MGVLGVVAAGRHEVRQNTRPRIGPKGRPEHVRPFDVLVGRLEGGERPDRKAPATVGVEERREDPGRLDVRGREPVDRAPSAHERTGLFVPDETVLLDRRVPAHRSFPLRVAALRDETSGERSESARRSIRSRRAKSEGAVGEAKDVIRPAIRASESKAHGNRATAVPSRTTRSARASVRVTRFTLGVVGLEIEVGADRTRRALGRLGRTEGCVERVRL